MAAPPTTFECPHCHTAVVPVVTDGGRPRATDPRGDSLVGTDVTCEHCGSELGVYFYS